MYDLATLILDSSLKTYQVHTQLQVQISDLEFEVNSWKSTSHEV